MRRERSADAHLRRLRTEIACVVHDYSLGSTDPKNDLQNVPRNDLRNDSKNDPKKLLTC